MTQIHKKRMIQQMNAWLVTYNSSTNKQKKKGHEVIKMKVYHPKQSMHVTAYFTTFMPIML